MRHLRHPLPMLPSMKKTSIHLRMKSHLRLLQEPTLRPSRGSPPMKLPLRLLPLRLLDRSSLNKMLSFYSDLLPTLHLISLTTKGIICLMKLLRRH